MADIPAIDFDIAPAYVHVLALASTSTGPEREAMMILLVQRIGPRQLARLFAQFMGLANSVAGGGERQTILDALAAIAAPAPPGPPQ